MDTVSKRPRPEGLLAVALAAGLSVLGCEPRVSLGGVCDRDSDCTASLECIARRCRSQCVLDLDCPDSEVCVEVAGRGSCQAIGEPVPCEVRSDCGGGVCVESTCRDPCDASRPCVDGECVGGACSIPDVIIEGRSPCTGLVCGAICTDPTRSSRHCGDCDSPCGEASACFDGRCGPADGDECATAVPIALEGPLTRFRPSLVGATNTLGSCEDTPDRFYAFVLETRSLVMVRADFARVGLTDACARPPTCGTELMGCVQNGLVRVLDAGEHVFVVEAQPTDPVSVEIHAIPVGSLDGTITYGPIAPGMIAGTTLGGIDTPASYSRGPDAWFAWTGRCNLSGTTALTFSTCGGADFDTTIEVRSSLAGGTGLGCEGADACGAQSRVTARIPLAEGLTVVFVDGASPADAGEFTLEITP